MTPDDCARNLWWAVIRQAVDDHRYKVTSEKHGAAEAKAEAELFLFAPSGPWAIWSKQVCHMAGTTREWVTSRARRLKQA